MRRLLSIAGVVYTAKSVFWDKLTPEQKNKYLEAAKNFINSNKHYVVAAADKVKKAPTSTSSTPSSHYDKV